MAWTPQHPGGGALTAVALDPLLVVPALVLFAGALTVGIVNWRWSLYGLLCYLPVSGIAILAAYGEREERAAAVLAKDFLFVIPAYVGFAVWAIRSRRNVFFPGAPIALFAALAGVVVVQAFNPALPNRLVGLIGMKIWLLYLPLFLLGYHLVRSRADLSRVLTVMSVLAVVPAAIGITEAALIYGGMEETVYGAYGEAAAAATQNYVAFSLPGGGILRRIPSTFSSFYQYYLFLAAMIAVVYAWWRGALRGPVGSWLGGALWLLMLAAVFLMGVRGAFLFIPLLVGLILVLERGSENRLPLRGWTAVVAGTAVGLAVVAAGVLGIFSHVWETLSGEFGDVVVDSTREAVSATWVGLGSGIDSTGSRYAFGEEEAAPGVDGKFHESWYVKTYLELGILGFAIVVALLGTIAVRSVRAHLRLRSGRLRVVSAAFVALLLWTMIYNVKAQYMDFDPLNVYFWLLAGMIARLPALDDGDEPATAARAGPS